MSKPAAIITVVLVAIIIIGYLIFTFISFKNQKWIFQPHQAKAPANACYPQISVTPLNQDEQNNLKANLAKVKNRPT